MEAPMLTQIVSNGKKTVVLWGNSETLTWRGRLYVNCTGHYSHQIGDATQITKSGKSLPRIRAWAEKAIA